MNIAVVGYPRSGNTWVSRTLGDILDCPVGGAHNAKPLCTEGRGRSGKDYVMQMHFKPQYRREVAQPSWEISVPEYDGDPLLLLVTRDPRDVVVSVKHYWNLSMDQALDAAGQGIHPLGVHGPWHVWHNNWLECSLPYALVRYEDIHAHGDAEWHRVMDNLVQLAHIAGDENLEYDPRRISGATERQEFENKRRQIEDDGHKRPYGKTIQLKHLYKGKVGSHRAEMEERHKIMARAWFAEVAGRFGYEL